MTQETKLWLDMAEEDYGVAKHLMDNYHPLPLGILMNCSWKNTMQRMH